MMLYVVFRNLDVIDNTLTNALGFDVTEAILEMYLFSGSEFDYYINHLLPGSENVGNYTYGLNQVFDFNHGTDRYQNATLVDNNLFDFQTNNGPFFAGLPVTVSVTRVPEPASLILVITGVLLIEKKLRSKYS